MHHTRSGSGPRRRGAEAPRRPLLPEAQGAPARHHLFAPRPTLALGAAKLSDATSHVRNQHPLPRLPSAKLLDATSHVQTQHPLPRLPSAGEPGSGRCPRAGDAAQHPAPPGEALPSDWTLRERLSGEVWMRRSRAQSPGSPVRQPAGGEGQLASSLN